MASAVSVLVLCGPDDATADAVVKELREHNVSVTQLDIGDFPLCMKMVARLADGKWEGELHGASSTIVLSDVRAVYYQRPTRFRFPTGMSTGDRMFAAAEARLGVGGVLASLDALWVNHPHRTAVAEYKPLQLQVAARCGLSVPATLITNDHGAVCEFAAATGGPVVVKSLSGVVLSEGGQPRIPYTTPVNPTTIEPESLSVTAHLAQARVCKKHDVRLTMVGREPFAVVINANSQAAQLTGGLTMLR